MNHLSLPLDYASLRSLYEDLRDYVLGGCHGDSLDSALELFLHHGMAGWMQAPRSGSTVQDDDFRAGDRMADHDVSSSNALSPSSWQAQAVDLLSDMLFVRLHAGEPFLESAH